MVSPTLLFLIKGKNITITKDIFNRGLANFIVPLLLYIWWMCESCKAAFHVQRCPFIDKHQLVFRGKISSHEKADIEWSHHSYPKDAGANPLRSMDGCWSSMGTAEWFPISSCSSSLPPMPFRRKARGSLAWVWGEKPGRWRRALITDAQQGPMAVAPAAGHLGASLTSTLSKNKKIRKGKWGHN